MEIALKVVDGVLNEILDDIIAQCKFRRYFKACNSDASLDDLLESSKKHFPSFACEDLKRKYSALSSVTKKTKTDLNKENFSLRFRKKLDFRELKYGRFARNKKNSEKTNGNYGLSNEFSNANSMTGRKGKKINGG